MPSACSARTLLVLFPFLTGLTSATIAAPKDRPAKGAEQPGKDPLGDPLPARALGRLGTTRLRDSDGMIGMVLSPDGKLLATLSTWGDVRFWDPATGKLIRKVIEGIAWYRSPRTAKERFTHIAFSAGGKELCGVINDRVQVRVLATGKIREMKEFGLTGYCTRTIAISPDGKILARAHGGVGCVENTVYVWNLAKSAIIRKLIPGKDTISTLAFSPDGRLLAGGDDYSADIFIWDMVTGKEVARLKGHKKVVWALAFSPDGKLLVSSGGGAPFMYRVWDVKGCRLLRQFKGGGAIAFSPDGKTLALGEPRAVRLIDATSDKTLLRMPFPADGINALCFTPDGKTLFAQAGVIKAWKLPGGKELFPWPGHVAPVRSLAFAPDGKHLASRGFDQTVRVWDLAARRQQHLLFPRGAAGYDSQEGGSQMVAFSPDGDTLAEVGWASIARWDARTGKPLGPLPGGRGGATKALAFSPDGKFLARSRDGTELYSFADRKWTHWLADPPEEARSRRFRLDTAVAFSPDGRTLAVGDHKNNIRIWDRHTGRILREFTAPKWGVACLAYSPDGKILGSCASSQTFGGRPRTEWEVSLWEAATGRLIRQLKGHKGIVECFAFAPDGRSLVSGGKGDRTVRLWQFWTGKEITRFEGHDGAINCVAYAPDGRTVASGSDDTTILLWDVSKLDTRFPPTTLGPKEGTQWWADLLDPNPATAYLAIAALAGASDDAVKFLRTRLRPVAEPDRKRVARLIADLDAEDFAVRDEARKELARFGEAIAPALRRALEAKPGVEARAKLKALLAEVGGATLPPETLRATRAIQVLEHVASRQARAYLAELAKGTPNARLTLEAQATLKRLDQRSKMTRP